MRRLEFLIKDVRKSTDNTDTNGISNNEIVQYFNDGQDYIAALVFKSRTISDFFIKVVELDADSNGVYTLPDDCFSTNAISKVEIRRGDASNNQGYTRLKPIMDSEFAYMFGYITRDNSILISGQNFVGSFDTIRITYFKRLKDLDIRRGQISAVTPNTSIAVTSLDTTVFDKDDNFSTVNKYGIQVASGLYSESTSSPLLMADTTGVVVNDYLVSGANSCNISELPTECETYLMDYVRQRIYTRNNYDDANKQAVFTEKQENMIVSIFAKNKKDDDGLPITDVDYLTW